MDFFLVGLGGAAGSLLRYRLGKIISEKADTLFPLGTFFINITGALLLGFVSSLPIGGNYYLLLADGFLGAYTTFSTFMYEGFNLFRDQEMINGAVYIAGSLLLGIIGYLCGSALGHLIR